MIGTYMGHYFAKFQAVENVLVGSVIWEMSYGEKYSWLFHRYETFAA